MGHAQRLAEATTLSLLVCGGILQYQSYWVFKGHFKTLS